MNTSDPYITSQEMIEVLHSMFGDFDKYAKCDFRTGCRKEE